MFAFGFFWTLLIALTHFIISMIAIIPINKYYLFESQVICEDCQGKDPKTEGEYGQLCAPGYIEVNQSCILDTTGMAWNF